MNRAIGQIDAQISELWNQYIESSDEELVIEAKRFRNKLLQHLQYS